MKPGNEDEADSLEKLEERIQQAVDTMSRLRQEKESALLEKESALEKLEVAQSELVRVTQELDTLRNERKHVRSRIEKLLGQIDVLSAS